MERNEFLEEKRRFNMQDLEDMALDCERKEDKKQGGMSTVEIILILVVLIALVIIFRDQITTLVNNIFSSIQKSASTIY